MCSGYLGYSLVLPLRFATGIVPNSQRLLDSSTYKIQSQMTFRLFTSFLNFESHYVQQISVRFISETYVSLSLFATLRG